MATLYGFEVYEVFECLEVNLYICRLQRQAQLKTSEAAVAAARADSLNRMTRQKDTVRGREVERLAAENEALTAMLLELASNNSSLKDRVNDIKSKYRVVRIVFQLILFQH